MKFMNTCRKYGAKLAAVSAGTLALASSAWAEVPAEVTQSLATAKTDALTVGGIVLGIIAAIFALILMRKVMR